MNTESRERKNDHDSQMLFDEKDYTGTYPYVADHVIGPYTPVNRDHPAYSAPAPPRGEVHVE